MMGMNEQQQTVIDTSDALAAGVRLPVPFFGQYAADVPEEWRNKVCGIASLRMALAYVLRDAVVPEMTNLIVESEAIKGWTPYGLSHDAVVRLAHNRGVAAYREEFRSIKVDTAATGVFSESAHAEALAAYGRAKLQEALVSGCVPIVSVTVPGKRDTHLVPLIGFSEDGWYYHDPAEYDAQPGAGLFITNEAFEQRFRNLVIFIGPAATLQVV